MTRKIKRLIFVSVLACSAIIGCRGDSRELTQVKAELEDVKEKLSQATTRNLNLSYENRELMLAYNQLQEQVKQLSSARDEALGTSQQVSQSASDAVNELAQRIVLLENEITELNLIIEEQDLTISEQEAMIAELTNSSGQSEYQEQDQGQVYQDIGFAY